MDIFTRWNRVDGRIQYNIFKSIPCEHLCFFITVDIEKIFQNLP